MMTMKITVEVYSGNSAIDFLEKYVTLLQLTQLLVYIGRYFVLIRIVPSEFVLHKAIMIERRETVWKN